MTVTTTAGAGYRETGLGWPGAMTTPGPAQRAGAGGPGQAAPPLEAGLGFRLGRAHRLLRAAWEEEIADLGLSPPQAALLRAVAHQPGCGLRELGRRMNTDAMNAKRLADHLERTDLVASSPDPGHRQRRALRPTAQGAALAGELDRRAAGHQHQLARLIGPAETARLLGLLDHLERAVASGLPAAREEGQRQEKRDGSERAGS